MILAILLIIIILGIALYPIPAMIVFDKIYFAIVDEDKEKAVSLYKKYGWILCKFDKDILKHSIAVLVLKTEQQITKENNGN